MKNTEFHKRAKELKDLESYEDAKITKKYKGCMFTMLFGIGCMVVVFAWPVITWVVNYLTKFISQL
tara:strand:- start:38 stop:235 length:198 start_codon:yes stop_codon:yes gene_type:complete